MFFFSLNLNTCLIVLMIAYRKIKNTIEIIAMAASETMKIFPLESVRFFPESSEGEGCTNAGCWTLMGFSSSGTFGRRRDLQYWFYGCSTKNRVFSFFHAQLTGFSHNFDFLVEIQKSTTNASWTDQLRCHVELDPAYPFPSLLSLGVTNEELHPLNHHAYLPRCS